MPQKCPIKRREYMRGWYRRSLLPPVPKIIYSTQDRDNLVYGGTPEEIKQERLRRNRIKSKQNNRDKILAYARAYHAKKSQSEDYKAIARARVMAWREKYPERAKAAVKKSHKSEIGRLKLNASRVASRKSRPELLLKSRIRARLAHALKGGAPKANNTEALLGCSFKHLRDYIESLFEPGMSWENRHLWHVDHIRPCASFNLLDPEQQRCCFHYSNLQPLWVKDNLEKSDKWLSI